MMIMNQPAVVDTVTEAIFAVGVEIYDCFFLDLVYVFIDLFFST